MPSVVFPENIQNLARKLRNLRLESERARRQKEHERKKEKKSLETARLKTGLTYAKKVFNWTNSFKNSEIGKELMLVSHIPTAYRNIFFFDGNIEGVNWIGLVVSPKGLFLNYGGRYSTFTQKAVKSPSELARAVDTEVLKTACQWIDNGKVWDCIERRFDYLKKY